MPSKDNGFERRFGASLAKLPGYSERVHDNGGKPTREVLCGDFKLYRPDGEDFAIECKSVGHGRIPFRDAGKKGSGIRDEQLAELARFEQSGPNRHSLVALHWAATDSCILVGMDAMLAYRKGSGYRSISEDDAARIGWRQNADGDGWRLRI